ncbi:MAG TPA: glycosyltransferase family 4 protein [Candidatus Elarobacter sp.]
MRIVWPAAYYGTHRGSFVPVIESVAGRLLDRGDRFDIVLPDLGPLPWHEELRALGAGVHLVRPYDARAAAAATRRLRPDVAHAHFDGWLVTVTAALWPARARVLWHLHSTFEPGGGPLRHTWRRAIKFRLVGRRVERFVVVTEGMVAEAERLGVPRRKIAVVPNAVDRARFGPPSPEERAAARAALGLGAGPAIAFFGRDPAIKGADVLADALARTRPLTVVTVATPPAAVAQLERSARVVAQPLVDDVRTVLWAVDAIAIPSRGEGMPYVALEALACGVPVVASALPWATELAARNGAVRVVPASDPAALAAALDAVLREPPRAAEAAVFDLEAWTERMLTLYDADW